MKALIYSLLVCVSGATATASILLNDNFAYSDGVLTNASGGRWRHASGGTDQVEVESGRVKLTRSETEDVEAALATSYAASSGGVIFSRFSLRVLSPPAGANGNYFAHLDGGSARARVFVVTNGAAVGRFRLGVAAGSSIASSVWPADLNTNETYTVVTRLVVSNAQVTLWLNPAFSSDASMDAADVVSPSSVNRFAWRQDSGMGELLVDDLVVATSFEEALLGNETPSISDLPNQQLAAGGSTAAIPFVVGDAEGAADALEVFARSAPVDAVTISFGGTGSNRTVSVHAISDQASHVSITLFVTDGITTNSDSFVVTIVPALLFKDDFSYPDSALLTNASPPWSHHSGSVTGQVEVLDGKVILSSALSEDVNVLLPGGPFSTNSGVTLYASFLVRFLQLPGSSGDYFAHFNTTGARCRIFANTANAAPGKFRVGIANASSTVSEQVALDLSTNTDYRVVLRYDPAAAASQLWINPSAETDAGAVATDTASPSSISAFAFRQDPGIGTIALDELRVGLTFASVTAGLVPRLRIELLPEGARIAWPLNATGFALQFTTDLGSTNWQTASASFILGAENVITNPMTGRMFFRLVK